MRRPITHDFDNPRTHIRWDSRRIAAWHETFNAALQGILTNPAHSTSGLLRVVRDCKLLLEEAAVFADLLHGAIPRVDTETGEEAREHYNHKGEE